MFSIAFRQGLPALVLFAVLAVSAPRCAWAVGGGTPDKTGKYPNACAVLGLREENPPRIASGVLIHPRVVLTAGHVTDWFATIWETPPDDVRVTFAFDAEDTTAWREVAAYETHFMYNDFSGAEGIADPHDIGLVILKCPVPGTDEDPVNGIDPAELPDEGLLDLLQDAGLLDFGLNGGTSMTVVGYGRGLSFPPPEELAEDFLRKRHYGSGPAMGMTRAFLHFYQDPEGVNTQRSDSGGPTFVKVDGLRMLVATTSWSGSLTGIDHRYRVDTPDAIGFIECIIAAVESGYYDAD
jgi:hypothetical protein